MPVATPVTPAPAARRSGQTDLRRSVHPDDTDSPPTAARSRWHLGHAALLLGALGFLLLMAMAPSLGKVGFRAAALGVGLASAFGVWRVGGDLDWGPSKRALLSLLALVPMAGFLVCVAVGARLLRRS